MVKNYIFIYVNGKPFNCSKNFSLKDLLLYLDINLNSNLVEYNGEIVQNPLSGEFILRQDDKIEVVTIVGGG